MGQEIAEGQGRRDDLSFLLEVEVIQAVASLRAGHDGHGFGRVVMMMVVLLVEIVLRRQVVGLLVVALVGARVGHQIDTADPNGHGRRAILEAAAFLPPPGAEDRDETRQRSYRLLVDWHILTTARSRGRLASLVTAKQLHGSGFAALRLAEEIDGFPWKLGELGYSMRDLDRRVYNADRASPWTEGFGIDLTPCARLHGVRRSSKSYCLPAGELVSRRKRGYKSKMAGYCVERILIIASTDYSQTSTVRETLTGRRVGRQRRRSSSCFSFMALGARCAYARKIRGSNDGYLQLR